MKRLSAFTLIELLVAMAVSSIVIAAGYVSYGIINRNYIDFRNNSSEMTQAAALRGVLSHDFNLAKVVKRYSSNEILVEMNDKGIVNYNWNENYVLRKNSIEQDTFFISLKKAELRFLDKDQDKAEGIIDELIFTTSVEGQEFIFYFDKQYGSDMIIENENPGDGRH